MKFKLMDKSEMKPKNEVRITKEQVTEMYKQLNDKKVIGFVFSITKW